MNNLFEFYSEQDKILIKEIIKAINIKDYTTAIERIDKRLIELENCKNENEYYLKIELAGFLIDIGEEGRIKESAIRGMQIIESERENIKGIITEGSIEYNLGNAKSSLFKIEREQKEFEYIPRTINNLIDAKNHYWRAYKYEIDNDEPFRPELVVNLANALSNCGRIVESLQFYDLVIKNYPDFPQANASRAKELIWLNRLTGALTQNLIYQAKSGYEKASKSKDVPTWMAKFWSEKAIDLGAYLKSLKFDEKTIHQEQEETKNEFESLSDYRKFCINNHLTLSEHSLYCNCIGARRDDLIICIPTQPFDAEFIPIMEKILNRLKSEFSLARILYYYSTQKLENEFTIYDSEVMFTELYDAESIGTKSEMLRTSFRLCFGVLDKIASAVCKIYDLADKKENIYFERFWNPKTDSGSAKQRIRWQTINNISNISLLALYTQATDLNNSKGEWSFFKSWRNALEHNQISILSTNELSDDIFNIYKTNPDILLVDENYFRSKSLQMLQLTRSAIFNFVFLVRNEARKIKPQEGYAIKHTFEFKNDDEK